MLAESLHTKEPKTRTLSMLNFDQFCHIFSDKIKLLAIVSFLQYGTHLHLRQDFGMLSKIATVGMFQGVFRSNSKLPRRNCFAAR